MRAQAILLIFFLSILIPSAILGARAKPKKGPYASKPYNNPMFAEFNTPPADELKDLEKLKDLKVLDFYQALDELYLTGGFEKSGTINNIILSQSEIPNESFKLLIKTLKKTRGELKNGDASLAELTYQLEMNDDDVITKNLLSAVKKAIRNATETSDSSVSDSFLQKISKIDLEDLKSLNGEGGGSEELADLLEELKQKIDKEDLKKISKAVQNAFHAGIGGVEEVKNSLIGGARLVFNMGVENAKMKCQEVKTALEIDSLFARKLDSALEIVRRMNRSEEGPSGATGATGYSLIFEAFFEGVAPQGNMIFLPSKLMKIGSMLPFFKDLLKTDEKEILIMMMNVSKGKSRVKDIQWFLDTIQDDSKTLESMRQRFGIKIPDQSTALAYRSVLERITSLSVDSAYLLRYVRSVKSITDTGNFKGFLELLIRFTQLSRDNTWRDVWNSIKEATSIATFEEDFEDLLAPFRGLNETISGSYEEVFLALKQILDGGEMEAKCQFIDEFFTGLSDQDTVLKAIGIEVDKMHERIDATEYIDALVDVLKAADTYKNLNRLLDFHGKYTTVEKKPLDSMDLIDDFINYLEQSGRWNRKRNNRLG